MRLVATFAANINQVGIQADTVNTRGWSGINSERARFPRWGAIGDCRAGPYRLGRRTCWRPGYFLLAARFKALKRERAAAIAHNPEGYHPLSLENPANGARCQWSWSSLYPEAGTPAPPVRRHSFAGHPVSPAAWEAHYNVWSRLSTMLAGRWPPAIAILGPSYEGNASAGRNPSHLSALLRRE